MKSQLHAPLIPRDNASADAACDLMTRGGDARIVLDPQTGLNRYHSAPRPSSVLAYASSTANDISADAYAHVTACLADLARDGVLPDEMSGAVYTRELERVRAGVRSAFALDDGTAVVFAPSGTDLEYVPFACMPTGRNRSAPPPLAILLGADEVGSGCIYSARGQYFAAETALALPVACGQSVPGLMAGGSQGIDLVDVPVRDKDGMAFGSDQIVADMTAALEQAQARGAHAILHVVHGSKTGLILPRLAELDRLISRFGSAMTVVVDACQARITVPDIHNYLARGAIMFITGSKFMGAPPFSGFALIPGAVARQAAALPHGLSTIFRRGEWPADWPGADVLSDGANPGLLLRIEAALFELSRFQALPWPVATRVIGQFHDAVDGLCAALGVRRVLPCAGAQEAADDAHPIEMRTLATLDLSGFRPGARFEDAMDWHRSLITQGVRLGQPARAVRLRDGGWGATLRIGLTMPMICARAHLDEAECARQFAADMAQIGDALRSCAGC